MEKPSMPEEVVVRDTQGKPDDVGIGSHGAGNGKGPEMLWQVSGCEGNARAYCNHGMRNDRRHDDLCIIQRAYALQVTYITPCVELPPLPGAVNNRDACILDAETARLARG